jgi:hypothetical protein
MIQTTDEKPPLFLCSVGIQGVILCETHAKAFELALMVANTPHTIIELEDEDKQHRDCQACDMMDAMSRPQIILPN